jgi:hypothetical protein
MQIGEFFDSRKRESARLVAELEKHTATWPDAKSKFDEIDTECVAIAAELSAALLAHSPTRFEIESRLKTKRWERDGHTHRHSTKRDELFRAIESFTNEPINDFKRFCLDRVKNLSKLYSYQRLESTHNLEGRRTRPTVRVSHNARALDAAKTTIFALIAEIDSMRHASLGEVESRIQAAKTEIQNFDYNTMQIEELTEAQDADMRPHPEPDDIAKGMVMPGGEIHMFNKDAGRLSNLKSRIEKLEGKL